MAKPPKKTENKTAAATAPDPSRPDKKRTADRASRRGPKAAIEQEITVASGRDMIMGIDPTKRSNSFRFLNIDEIIRMKGGFTEYKRMKNDDAVKAALSFKKILVYGRAYDLDPASDDEKDKDVADFVTWAFKRAKLKRIVKEMLTALDYGFSVGEIIWEYALYKGKPCITLKTVKFRDPETIEFNLDRHGNIANVIQIDTQFNANEINIPYSKVLHYAHQGELGNVYGVSDLRSIYKNWWAKKFLVNFWNVYLERLGSPTLLMKYPKGASSKLQQTLKEILSDLGNRAELLVPEGVAVDVLESTRAGQATYNEALIYHDGAIAKGILVPALLGFGDKQTRGADSQSRLQLRTLFKVTDEIGQECSEIIQEKIIKYMVDLNYDVQEYPELIWQSYGEYEATEIADVIRLLHNAGVVDMDQEDVNYVRSIVGLPVRGRKDDEDEVLRPLPAPQGTGANPPTSADAGGAKQGNETGKTGGAGGGGKQSSGAKARAPVRNSADGGVVLARATRKRKFKAAGVTDPAALEDIFGPIQALEDRLTGDDE
jgi:phage gp29-like protein